MLTTKQKIKVLKRCIKEIEAINENGRSEITGRTFYLCFKIGKVAKLMSNKFTIFDSNHYVNNIVAPNLIKYKPKGKGVDSIWFEVNKRGNKSRIKVLNKLIAELENPSK